MGWPIQNVRYCREKACVIVRLLDDIAINDKNRERPYNAKCLRKMIDVEFCTMLVFIKEILRECKSASDFLQNPSNSLSDGVDIINTLTELLKSLRNEIEYSRLTDFAHNLANVIGISSTNNGMARNTNLPMRFSDSVTETTVGKTVTIDEFRTRIFYPLIDFCMNEMDRRFSEQNKIIMKGISALTPGNTHFLDWKLIKPFAEIYGCNLEDLELEIKNMSGLISRKQEADVPKGLFDFCNLATRLRDAFFELHRLLVISCVLPVSTASCERSFSTLRTTKNYLHSAMTDERLNSLMVLGIQAKRAQSLNLDKVVDKFKDMYPNMRIAL